MSAAVDLTALGLSAEDRAARLDLIGGSDANTLMSGDIERVNNLWEEKLRLREPDDLSDVLQVQLGAFTEPFNVAWYEKHTGRKVIRRGEALVHLDHDWMGATLDGVSVAALLVGDLERVFEAKHVSAFAKPDEVLAKYLPQLTHNMLVAGLQHADLSVIFGNHKFEVFSVKLDADYAEQLMAVEEAFWRCVQTRTRPHAVAVKAPVPVSAMRVVDMAGSNAWSVAAADWVANKVAAKTFEDAAKTLKALVADDVKEAFGSGVQAKRNAAGSISISEIKPPKGQK